MASNSAIWRCTTLGAEGSNSTDIIEFNDLTLADNLQRGISQSNTTMTTALSVNPKPKTQTDELQDCGFAGLTVILTGSIKDPPSGGLASLHKLKQWELEPKYIDTLFPYGRFGLRMDDMPIFDLTPGTTRGYMLESVSFIRDGEVKSKASVIITLRFNASSVGSPNGSGQYIW